MCNCKNIEVGSFNNQILLDHPNLNHPVWVDACIADEIRDLLSKGVKTIGSCCGHNKLIPCIAVAPESIVLMEKLGYRHQFNRLVPTGPWSRIYFYAKSVKCSWIKKLIQDWLPFMWWSFWNQ